MPAESNFPSFDSVPRFLWGIANRLGIFPQRQLREVYMTYRKHLWTKAVPVGDNGVGSAFALVKTHPALRIATERYCVWPKPLKQKQGEPYIVFDIFEGPIEGMTWEVLSERLRPAGPWKPGQSDYRKAAEMFLGVAKHLPSVSLEDVFQYNAPDVR